MDPTGKRNLEALLLFAEFLLCYDNLFGR
jgi:hypothetical protein